MDIQTNARPIITLPPIGYVLEGQGGAFLGIARGFDGAADAALILAPDVLSESLPWKECVDWGASVRADGHTDFQLWDRFESALTFANARDLVDPAHWYWTRTQFSRNVAYFQDFYYGLQDYRIKSFRARARAVRRLPLDALILQLTRS